ncbi:hypothetical protein AOLI_G00270930 [Acnodon oligacanthus]
MQRGDLEPAGDSGEDRDVLSTGTGNFQLTGEPLFHFRGMISYRLSELTRRRKSTGNRESMEKRRPERSPISSRGVEVEEEEEEVEEEEEEEDGWMKVTAVRLTLAARAKITTLARRSRGYTTSRQSARA